MLTRIWKELSRRISSAGPLPGYLTMTSTLRLSGSGASSSVSTKGMDSPWKETKKTLDLMPLEIKKSLTKFARLDETFKLYGYIPTGSITDDMDFRWFGNFNRFQDLRQHFLGYIRNFDFIVSNPGGERYKTDGQIAANAFSKMLATSFSSSG